MSTTYIDNPASVRQTLAAPWGTVVTNGQVVNYICPLCQAIIPASFTNAHETSQTPKDSHSANHVAIAEALASLKEAQA